MLSSVRRSSLSVALLGLYVLLASDRAALSQSQSINGTIRGVVVDAAGASIANATITVTNLDTGFRVSVQTAGDGLYVAASLPIGTYSVKAEAQGFAAVTQTGVHLDAGTSATVDEKLSTGSLATVVEVTSDARDY